MEQNNKSSILAFIIALPLVFCLLVSAYGAKLYTGGEKYEQDNVIALTLTLNGKLMSGYIKKI